MVLPLSTVPYRPQAPHWKGYGLETDHTKDQKGSGSAASLLFYFCINDGSIYGHRFCKTEFTRDTEEQKIETQNKAFDENKRSELD